MRKKKLFSVEEINSLLEESYTLGYCSARLFYESQLLSKKETEIKNKTIKEFLKKVVNKK